MESNFPLYQFNLGARLMKDNQACIICRKNAGFTLKSTCENCSSTQDVLDTAFALTSIRHNPLPDGNYVIKQGALDQLEAALVTLARKMGLEQQLAFRSL